MTFTGSGNAISTIVPNSWPSIEPVFFGMTRAVSERPRRVAVPEGHEQVLEFILPRENLVDGQLLAGRTVPIGARAFLVPLVHHSSLDLQTNPVPDRR